MGEETISRVLHDLKVVSRIRENDKIFTDGGFLNLDHGGFSSSIYRWINSENRVKGLASINNIITDAFAIAENGFRKIETKERQQEGRELHLTKLKSYHLVSKVRCAIADSLLGLKHMKATYYRDTSMIAKIDVLQQGVIQGLRELDCSIVILGNDLKIDNADKYKGVPDLSPRFTECQVVDADDRFHEIVPT